MDRRFKKTHLYRVDISLEIEKEFNNEIEIDFVILNEATPRFLYNVLKSGYCIYAVNETLQHEFSIKIIREYLDVKPMLDMYDKMTVMEVIDDKNK